MTSLHKHLFCFGYGYCAKTFAGWLTPRQWAISGTSRSDYSPSEHTSGPIIHPFDGNRPLASAREALEDVTHILVSIPPGKSGDPALIWHKDDIAQLKSLEWLGYLSTTGVYGNTDGEWVDETSPTHPTSSRSESRLKAETEWLDLYRDAGVPVHVFRLPGIYGPGRSAIDQVRAGNIRRIEKPKHQFSRIHVADIAQTLAASIAAPNPGRIYNVCDDEPAPPADVTALACELLGVPTPAALPFDVVAKEMSPMALSFWQDNRRVDNQRIKSELGVRLLYPTYRDGLQAIYEGSSDA